MNDITSTDLAKTLEDLDLIQSITFILRKKKMLQLYDTVQSKFFLSSCLPCQHPLVSIHFRENELYVKLFTTYKYAKQHADTKYCI